MQRACWVIKEAVEQSITSKRLETPGTLTPMMNEFLANNRDNLIARCVEKVARRPKRAATAEQLKNGILMFIDS